MPHTMRAMEKGAQVEPIAILVRKNLNCIMFQKDLGVEKPSDLSNKVIGYCVDGFETRYLNAILELNDIVPKKMRNVSFDLVSTLGTKKVDAVFGVYWNIEGEQLRSLNIDTDYFEISRLGVPSHYELIIIARKNPSPEFVTAFKKALQESIDLSREHPEEAFDCYLRANPDKREKTCAWERNAWMKTLPAFADNQEIDPKVLSDFDIWLREHHLL
jgi:NitT/TauT family transport system substrate-binding protein